MESKVEPKLEKTIDTQLQPQRTNFLSMLKTQIGNADSFAQFEQFVNMQNEELIFVKKDCEQLRAALSKSQEDRRSLELQLVAEKALRNQETRNSQTAIENNTIQLNAQIYAIKFEKEKWAQKAEATVKESELLKEQLKVVETEKSEALRKLAENTDQNSGFENFRRTFELYRMRIEDTIQNLSSQISELQTAKDELRKLLNSFQEEVNVLNVYVKTQAEHIAFTEQRANNLEKELFQRKNEC